MPQKVKNNYEIYLKKQIALKMRLYNIDGVSQSLQSIMINNVVRPLNSTGEKNQRKS